MQTVILVVHILIGLALVGLVLIQQGKGADAGASFGSGSSATVFGSAGGSTFFTKLTTALAIAFFCTSLALAVFARHSAEDEGLIIVEQEEIPAVETIQPTEAESEVPVIEVPAEESVVPVTE